MPRAMPHHRLLAEIVDLDEAGAWRVVAPPDHCRIVASGQGQDHGGFTRIAGRRTGALDFGLLSVTPIIVGSDLHAVSVTDIEHWIWQCIRDAGSRQ